MKWAGMAFIRPILLLLLAWSPSTDGTSCMGIDRRKESPVEVRHTALTGVLFDAKVHIQATTTDASSGGDTLELWMLENDELIANTTVKFFNLEEGPAYIQSVVLPFKLETSGLTDVRFQIFQDGCSSLSGDRIFDTKIRAIPAWLSVLPPLITLILAVAFRGVMSSLFVGIFVGALLLNDYNPATAIARSLDTLIPDTLADSGHSVVILFSFMLAGMVAIMEKSGGTDGLTQVVLKWVNSRKRVNLATWCMGMLVFFDGQASILIVGNTVRPVIDQLQVSHEKLAFIVDCTAAPIASVAPISSWIGFELSLITDEFNFLGITSSPYIALLDTLTCRFYPLLMLFFVVVLILLEREFGPMYAAELRTAQTGTSKSNETEMDVIEQELLKPKSGVPKRWYNALVPIILVIVCTFVGLIVDGYFTLKEDPNAEISVREIFKAADSYRALMWSGTIAFIVPLIMYWAQGIMDPRQTTEVWIDGMKSLLDPILVLLLAWTLGTVIKETALSFWLVQSLEDFINKEILSTIVFIFCSIISFCTGSSWSTMSIMFPIVVPLAHGIGKGDYDTLIQSMGSVLAGSVFGDHCSPISDTTILSSLATRCNLDDHVKTQTPYALLVACVSILLGILPAGYLSWYNWYISLPLCMIALVGVLFLLGKKVPKPVHGKDLESLPTDSSTIFKATPASPFFKEPELKDFKNYTTNHLD